MGHRGKGKRLRSRALSHKEKTIARKRLRSNKFKHSGWKLNFPDLFKVIDHFPFIVRKDDRRYK
ncbi:hypothetical protein LCGC14_0770490 [marine sediment metagenome]|uniref:Uncharacterized protein n=1 Tax=marine sediment metagenome TaxID=412755 RepID=A0A0F9T5C8_9ZZZZ